VRPSESRGYGSGSGSGSIKPSQGAKGSLAALVRRAAELCDNMYELRIKYHDGHSELDPPGQFPVHMSGEVLQAADDFLRLLRCFFVDDLPTHGHGSSSTPSLVSDNRSSRSSYASMTSSVSLNLSLSCGLPPPPPPPPPEQLLSSRGGPTITAPRVAYTADRPAALTLIASYRRLLDLYLLYYQAVYEYVRDTEPAWRRAQPIWRDLNVGGAPLREFGDLHIKLVVQAAARVLEDVESALGLSEGCRVSRKPMSAASGEGEGGGNGGVLGSVVTSRFVEQCIAEGTAGGGGDQGPGVIARIREMAASLAAFLDAPVAMDR
jgi:hypothetical protein